VSALRLGQVDYINCLPVYHALEEGIVPLEAELVKGPPTTLNQMFLAGYLDVTPISSIEYARNADSCLILPNLSISACGRVESILLFSKIPVTELEGKKVYLTESSATSVALLKVLFDHYYHVEVHFSSCPPDLDTMMDMADGALLIGDDAMLAHQKVKDQGQPYQVTDLGEAWQKFTGEKMVYAVWVVRRNLAEAAPEKIKALSEALMLSKEASLSDMAALVTRAHNKSGLSLPVIENYFYNTMRYEFDDSYRRALLLFYDYAYKSGLINERVKLCVWGEDSCV
jgi:chorismate dehydratase